ncbi:DEAD/DEAH box helicase family protein [Bartonella sp. M0283]|uniref:EcoAI/FtnUII family type I restriction enzme subunit R n=1 Tax=Bartonella sp. M0283 TaxID=2751016 RepID=UPI0018DBFC4B|nr:DEAD/DEAH box helicase family protein [Bartonella sp. M0283]MBI0162120.1 DEAD/DEAH box helicase family protein [Bartonella sp. M0283]
MHKKLSEEDVKTRYVTPALVEKAGWDKHFILTEYYFTAGQVLVTGNKIKRGQAKRADYLLLAPNKETPLAVIEAKRGDHPVGDGMQQAKDYASILDVPFAYSTNGIKFLEHDMFTGIETMLEMDKFPTQVQLWARYISHKKLDESQQEIIGQPYFIDASNKIEPRYYQRIAIDRTVEAIALGQKRILLVMATGTGKTYTAFQIIWRLKQAKPNMKVLYLADRNILIDQTISNDFKPFEKVITKVRGKTLDSSYEIYMSLYQQLVSEDGNDTFKQFKREFFDLIIVDECHRGSAKEDSQWRRILDYFDSATQIGLTATPKETKDVSNQTYFGEPVYTYSLKQGIEDGFLAPYVVIRITIDKDVEGWRPELGQVDINGNPIPDKEYDQKDFDRTLIIDERTKLVAKRVTEWLKKNGRDNKTIVFCIDVDHAERMRQALNNENSDIVKTNPDYIMRITGDNKIGKDRLDDFIDPNAACPTIVTTSKLLTTGVDCKTCKLIVLDSPINSMTEFKQIIGRGTRLDTKHKKWFFTIMDFRGNSKAFDDKEFDGEPIVVIENPETTGTGDGTEGPDVVTTPGDIRIPKLHVNNVDVQILDETEKTLNADGKLEVENLASRVKRCILNAYPTSTTFLDAWNAEEHKSKVIKIIEEKGAPLTELQQRKNNNEYDLFDLILAIGYGKKPMKKAQRVTRLKNSGYLNQFTYKRQKIILILLDKYINEGILLLDDNYVLNGAPFDKIGSPKKIVNIFGGIKNYNEAIKNLKNELYIC